MSLKASADKCKPLTVQNCSSKRSVRPINNVEDEGEAEGADADMEDQINGEVEEEDHRQIVRSVEE